MKIISYILKIKIPFSVALLLIVATAVNAEVLFLQGIKLTNRASDAAVAASLMPGQTKTNVWLKQVMSQEKAALNGAKIPLVVGSQRLTFARGSSVRYRVAAPANLVAKFYRLVLTNQGWQANGSTAGDNSDHLTIALAENPLSGKTDITYGYVAAKAVAVLGVKIAEADLSAPAPSQEFAPQPMQPAPEQPAQPQPIQQPQQPMMPPTTTEQQPTTDQYQSQPPNQPITNEMQFKREPSQPSSGEQNTSQTCRVNGVEMPGSCEKYNNQNQGPNGPGEQMNGQRQQGPSEQDQKRMEEEQKKNDERRFKDMKKGLSQFANGAKMMKKNLARMKTANAKCGVGMPEELENALAQTDSLVAKINAAKTADELDEIVGDIQDVGSVMQDWGPRMGDLNRTCQMLRQADRDIKQFDKNIKRLESQAKANKKVDVSELIAEYKTAVNAQKEILAQAKVLAKTDPESALSKIEDDFYGNMDNLGNLQMQLDVILNISRGLKNLAREINNFTSQIKTLARKKIDTAEMQELLNGLKTRVEEIKTLIKEKADAEDLISKIEEAFDSRQELQDLLQEYDMLKMIPQIKGGGNFNVKMNLPEAFRKNKKDNGENEITAESAPGPSPIRR